MERDGCLAQLHQRQGRPMCELWPWEGCRDSPCVETMEQNQKSLTGAEGKHAVCNLAGQGGGISSESEEEGGMSALGPEETDPQRGLQRTGDHIARKRNGCSWWINIHTEEVAAV